MGFISRVWACKGTDTPRKIAIAKTTNRELVIICPPKPDLAINAKITTTYDPGIINVLKGTNLKGSQNPENGGPGSPGAGLST
jgi:hypothetical protein